MPMAEAPGGVQSGPVRTPLAKHLPFRWFSEARMGRSASGMEQGPFPLPGEGQGFFSVIYDSIRALRANATFPD